MDPKGHRKEPLKRAIFLSAGLGDSLLTLPLAKQLRLTSKKLVAILTSTVMTRSFLEKLSLFDHIVELPRSSCKLTKDWPYYRCLICNFRRFDEVYLPRFSLSKQHQELANCMGGRVVVCDSQHDTAQVDVHDAVRHFSLIQKELPALTADLIAFPSEAVPHIVCHLPNELKHLTPLAIVQVSGVQDMFPQKAWPIAHWEAWLRLVVNAFPQLNWVLINGPREQPAIAHLMSRQIPHVYATPPNPTLEAAASMLQAAEVFVGLDGGLMHLAACLDRPTFTIWGASNPRFYGYEQMHPLKHRVVSTHPACGPCESWLNPNQTRVTVPKQCPDFRCIRELSPTTVFHEFKAFLSLLNT
jgi:hypothetical protein